ncbi:hypothetical protein QE436_003547 [Pantoea anthophila]|nr:hypothetical protein [Pantoea anthophila]
MTGIRFPAIAHAVDGTDKGLLAVEILQLAPQILDMAVDGAIRHYAVIIIEMVEQLLARKDLARFQRQGFQQTKLGRG